MKVLITGASGYIGSALIPALKQKNFQIIALSRDAKKIHDPELQVLEHLEDIPSAYPLDSIVNLAGAPIDKRWSDSYKNVVLRSRIEVTQSLYRLVARLKRKPKTVISASAVGYYGNQGSGVLDENSRSFGGFTHQVCKQWEQQAQKMMELGTSVSIIRLGVVLGKECRILKKLLPVFYMGLGGRIGSGEQYISWVHVDDVVRAMLFLLERKDEGRVYNLTAPGAVTNAQWTRSLSRALHRFAVLPIPKTMVRLVFGQMGESLLLEGQNVFPKNLIEAGFTFTYRRLDAALYHIINAHKK